MSESALTVEKSKKEKNEKKSEAELESLLIDEVVEEKSISKLKTGFNFADLAGITKEEQAQIVRFFDNNNELIRNKNKIKVAKYMGLTDKYNVSDEKIDMCLEAAALAKVANASEDYNNVLSSDLDPNELPELKFGGNGKVFSTDDDVKKSVAMLAIANMSEKMTLMSVRAKLDNVHAAFYNANLTKGFLAAKDIIHSLNDDENVKPRSLELFNNAYKMTANNLGDKNLTSQAQEYFENRQQEFNSYNSSEKPKKKTVEKTTQTQKTTVVQAER